MEYRDSLGNEIEVGDTIIYPGRWGSSLFLRIAVVTELSNFDNYWRDGPALKVRSTDLQNRYHPLDSRVKGFGQYNNVWAKTQIINLDMTTIIEKGV